MQYVLWYGITRHINRLSMGRERVHVCAPNTDRFAIHSHNWIGAYFCARFFFSSSLHFFSSPINTRSFSDRIGSWYWLLWLLLVHISFIWFLLLLPLVSFFFSRCCSSFWSLVWFLTRLLFLWLSALFLTTFISFIQIFLSGTLGCAS